MAKYAHIHFGTYVKEADIKQQILLESLVRDNLGQVKKLDNSVGNILKGKRKQEDSDMDVTFEKIQLKNACMKSALLKL